MTTSASSLEQTALSSSNRAVSSSAPRPASADHARLDKLLPRRAVPRIGHAGDLDTGVLGRGFESKAADRRLQSSTCGIPDVGFGGGEGDANYMEMALQIVSVCNHGVEIDGKNITLAECLASTSDFSSEAVAQYKELYCGPAECITSGGDGSLGAVYCCTYQQTCDYYTAALSSGILDDKAIVEQICGVSECCRSNDGVLDEACFPSEYSASFEDCTALEDQSDSLCCTYRYKCSLQGSIYPDDPTTPRVCSVAECCQEINGTFSTCHDEAFGSSSSSQPTPSPQIIDLEPTKSPFGFTPTANKIPESTLTPSQATRSPSIVLPGSEPPFEGDNATKSPATDKTGAFVSSVEDDILMQTQTPTVMVDKEPQVGQESTNGVARKATSFLSVMVLYLVLS
mmetsp:Transcript_12665/g.29930  ORF Transcript_12665/g.29930 Transcript_12665/m.29930 type:complete len:399 (+) Transcript_12665:155-1351(+)